MFSQLISLCGSINLQSDTFLIQSSSSFLKTCPYHRSLPVPGSTSEHHRHKPWYWGLPGSIPGRNTGMFWTTSSPVSETYLKCTSREECEALDAGRTTDFYGPLCLCD